MTQRDGQFSYLPIQLNIFPDILLTYFFLRLLVMERLDLF